VTGIEGCEKKGKLAVTRANEAVIARFLYMVVLYMAPEKISMAPGQRINALQFYRLRAQEPQMPGSGFFRRLTGGTAAVTAATARTG
jgi:hypothetical protein